LEPQCARGAPARGGRPGRVRGRRPGRRPDPPHGLDLRRPSDLGRHLGPDRLGGAQDRGGDRQRAHGGNTPRPRPPAGAHRDGGSRSGFGARPARLVGLARTPGPERPRGRLRPEPGRRRAPGAGPRAEALRPLRDRTLDDPGGELPPVRRDRPRRRRPQPPAPGDALRPGADSSGFRKLWAGQSVSRLGSAVTTFALPTAAVLQLHAGPFEVGLLMAVNKVAFPLLGLPVGVWIDRLPRRPVMIAADLGRALALSSLPAAAFSGHLTLPLLYAVAGLMGVLTLLFDVAYLAYVPSLVGREEIRVANSRMQVSESVAEITGPGLAGFLVQAVGAAQTIAVDAFSFLVSALSLAWIRSPEPPSDRP